MGRREFMAWQWEKRARTTASRVRGESATPARREWKVQTLANVEAGANAMWLPVERECATGFRLNALPHAKVQLWPPPLCAPCLECGFTLKCWLLAGGMVYRLMNRVFRSAQVTAGVSEMCRDILIHNALDLASLNSREAGLCE